MASSFALAEDSARQAAANKAEVTNVFAKADADSATTRAGGVKTLGPRS